MPEPGPRGQRPDEQARPPAEPSVVSSVASSASAVDHPADPPGASAAPPSVSPGEARAARFTPANMARSLLPLVVLCLVIVGFTALRQNPEDPVREVSIDSSVFLSAERAGYPVLVPQGLPEGWRPTSVRTDAGGAEEGDPITLQIGWYTPAEEYAGYVISDDADANALTDVLENATEDGTAQVGGAAWQRLISERGETVLTRTAGEATLLVTGSAPDEELQTLAAAVRPVTP